MALVMSRHDQRYDLRRMI